MVFAGWYVPGRSLAGGETAVFQMAPALEIGGMLLLPVTKMLHDALATAGNRPTPLTAGGIILGCRRLGA